MTAIDIMAESLKGRWFWASAADDEKIYYTLKCDDSINRITYRRFHEVEFSFYIYTESKFHEEEKETDLNINNLNELQLCSEEEDLYLTRKHAKRFLGSEKDDSKHNF